MRFQTKHLRADRAEAIDEAAGYLRQGKLVVYPTDTVYGLAASAHGPAAIERLFQVKGRPADKGIPILLAEAADVTKVAREVPAAAERLMARYWPGPLTLVLPRLPGLPEGISANDGVAVRVPDHPVARQLIQAAGGALPTTSANRSGGQPAETAADALRIFEGQVAAVLDGGPARLGLASTIVDCTTTPPQVLRLGPVSEADIAAALG
jgi:L-threonylcarbamoyladenylate synthase